jgi:hypothetical protein
MLIKPSAIAVILFISISCGNARLKEYDKQMRITSQIIDSTALLSVNLKHSSPYFTLKLDSSVVDTAKYSVILYPDTTQCHSWWFNRLFLGQLKMAKSKVLTVGSDRTRFHLKTGNLNLWVCNLPQKVNTGDTVYITALVYNIMGSEKTWGYPTIITAIRM